MTIDSHMHINHAILTREEIERQLSDIKENKNLESAINVGINIETSKEAIELAKQERKLYATVGIHPHYVEEEKIKELYHLADQPKVVAIGEVGLDDTKNNHREQKRALIRQIMIANEFRLPVVIHANNTNSEVREIFEKYVKPQYGCVFHCFQPDIEMLNYLVENGYYISFAGRITYKNAKKSIEVAKQVPKELYLVETDSPFISPEPVREEQNKSSNIEYIIKKLAEVRETSEEEVRRETRENAKTLFKKMR